MSSHASNLAPLSSPSFLGYALFSNSSDKSPTKSFFFPENVLPAVAKSAVSGFVLGSFSAILMSKTTTLAILTLGGGFAAHAALAALIHALTATIFYKLNHEQKIEKGWSVYGHNLCALILASLCVMQGLSVERMSFIALTSLKTMVYNPAEHSINTLSHDLTKARSYSFF